VITKGSAKPAKSRKGGGVTRSIRKAFSGWWSVLGIVAASITGFNLARNIFQVELADVFAEIAQAYEKLVHAPLLWLFARLNLDAPPAWAIDTGVLWVLIGGVVARTAWVLRTSLKGAGAVTLGLPEQMRSIPPAVFFVVAWLLWPVAAFLLIREPLVHTVARDDSETVLVSSGRLDRPGWPNPGGRLRYAYDLRVVLATQAVVAAVCVLGWFVLNALVELYG